MKIAAVQMVAEFANVEANLNMVERLTNDAFLEGAEWVILPEFLTSAMGFHPKMQKIARDINGKPMKILKSLSSKHNGVVGGSFVAYRENNVYNTWLLVFPDGTTYFHDKDQPTMWENCYYIGGKDDGVLETPIGNVGVAMCWELIRTRTAKRLINKIDFLVGGSCWWTLPEKHFPGFPQRLHQQILDILIETPAKLAKMLGVHVVHASHAGNFKCKMPLIPRFPYESYYQGETQIVDGSGKILARMKREEGEGFIIADINHKKKWEPSEPIPDSFWIPDLPRQIKFIWWYQNKHGRRYYRKKVKPFINIYYE
jgi:predicted amidohydrolase